MSVRRALTRILQLALWLMVAGVVVQFFLAGLFNFGEAGARDTHEGVGWGVHTLGMVALLLSIAGPRSKPLMLGMLGLVVLNTIQILLSQVDTAAVAALHPVLGLAVLGGAITLASRTGRALASPATTGSG
jgi:hypothetical protein